MASDSTNPPAQQASLGILKGMRPLLALLVALAPGKQLSAINWRNWV